MSFPLATSVSLSLILLAGCGEGAPQGETQRPRPKPSAVRDAPPPRPLAMAPGTTPVAERVAVLGLLNKRNGIAQDLTLKPGEAVRVGDVVVRLRNCERTASWEPEQLTGAFVQVDVEGTDRQLRRAFSGWLYAESPSLNVVEHPVYDVWPKSCAMTHPGEAAPASNGSSAPQSGRGSEPSSPAPTESDRTA